MNELLKFRSEFPILERTTYLISNSLGVMPRGVYDRLRDYAVTWVARGVRAWEEGLWEMAVTVGDKVGALEILQPGPWNRHPQAAVKATGA